MKIVGIFYLYGFLGAGLLKICIVSGYYDTGSPFSVILFFSANQSASIFFLQINLLILFSANHSIISFLQINGLIRGRSDHVSSIPWPAERRPSQVGRQHGPLPSPPLLHAWVRSPHLPWLATVQVSFKSN